MLQRVTRADKTSSVYSRNLNPYFLFYLKRTIVIEFRLLLPRRQLPCFLPLLTNLLLSFELRIGFLICMFLKNDNTGS